MKKITRMLLSVCLSVFIFSSATVSAQNATPLDYYIAKPDSHYKYSQYAYDREWLTSTYFLSMTSQKWRDESEVDRPIWEHEVSITVPWQAKYLGNKTALLLINGGGNNSNPKTKASDELVLIALLTGKVVVNLRQVPNQPLQFLDETPANLRTEDAILAYGLDHYLNSCTDPEDPASCDSEWVVHLPMTKAVVRAMDTAQDFLDKKRIKVDDFVVAGGSKRGWTTWLTAAVDTRVKGIVPISIDILNIQEQIDRHWASYNGTYAEAISDYAGFDLFCRSRKTASGKAMWDMIDPYAYRQRLDMPKLIVNSSGDQFFLPDSSRQYYKDLPGDNNRLRYTYNSDHKQEGSELDAILGALTWMEQISDNETPPAYDWEVIDNKIIVTVADRVEAVNLWQATDTEDPLTRDFRLDRTGEIWSKTQLSDLGNGRYEAEMIQPPEGQWTAYSIELVFDDLMGEKYTTDIFVTPDTFPLNPADHCKTR